MTDADHDHAEDVLPPPEHTPAEDAKENTKKAVRELILVGVVLFLIFVVFLPRSSTTARSSTRS